MSLLKVQADGPHARSVTGNKATFSDRGRSECVKWTCIPPTDRRPVAQDNEDDDDDDDEYVVEKLVNRRMNCGTGRYEYLVRWGGFPPEDDTWEPAEGLPADTRSAFDATLRSSGRSRARTAA